MRENLLTNKILKNLKKKFTNSWWYKIPDPSRCPACGTISVVSKRPFDIIGSIDGLSVAIEVKTLNGKLAKHQKAQLMLHAYSGGLSIVAWEEVSVQVFKEEYGKFVDYKVSLYDYLKANT